MVLCKSIRAVLSCASAALLMPGVAMAAPALLQPLEQDVPRPLVTDGFCWVAGVDRSAKGVAVHFRDERRVRVQTPDGGDWMGTYGPLPVTGDPSESEGPVLHLAVGSTFLAMGTPGDNCSGEVGRDAQGRIGVKMKASVAAAIGGKIVKDSSEKFIVAQPADAVVREELTDTHGLYIQWPGPVEAIPALRQEFASMADEVEEMLKGAAKEAVTEPGTTERAAVTIVIRLAGDDGRLLSLRGEGAFYFGGAHPIPGRMAILWDRKADAEIAVNGRTLFTDGLESLRASYCAALDAERARRSDWVPGSGQTYLDIYECPAFDRLAIVPAGEAGQPFDRITFVAAPYVAGPYSDGEYAVTFPVTSEFIGLIASDYRPSFKPYTAPAPRG